jgi:hypothetical protein
MSSFRALQPHWIWKLYFFVYLITTSYDTFAFYAPYSGIQLYYHTLLAYDIYFLLVYLYSVLFIIFNMLAILPFFYFIYRVRVMHPLFWQWLFLFRVVSAFLGQTYLLNTIKSLFYHDPWVAWSTIFTQAVIQIPSHVVFGLYAFNHPHEADKNQPPSFNDSKLS